MKGEPLTTVVVGLLHSWRRWSYPDVCCRSLIHPCLWLLYVAQTRCSIPPVVLPAVQGEHLITLALSLDVPRLQV
jgi:hypothetical protein